PHFEMTSWCLSRHPALSYLCLVRCFGPLQLSDHLGEGFYSYRSHSSSWRWLDTASSQGSTFGGAQSANHVADWFNHFSGLHRRSRNILPFGNRMRKNA